MPFPNYPDILRPADWDKKKGALAKTAGETGVGAAMTNLIKTLDAVKLDALVPLTTYKNEAAVDEAIKTAKANASKLVPASQAAYKVRDLAKAAAVKFKKPLIPKSSVDHALAVMSAADHYGIALKSYDPLPEFEDARKRVQIKLAAGLKSAKSYAGKVETNLGQFKNATTVNYPAWEKYWKEDLRGLNAAIAVVPALKDHAPLWRTMTSEAFRGDSKTLKVEDIKKKAGQIDLAIGKLKGALG